MKGQLVDDVALMIHESDTVATAIEDLGAGHCIARPDDDPVELTEDIPFGHKIALESLSEGDTVYKYGEVIGTAVDEISPGDWVHTHNCESTRGRGDRNPMASEATE